MYLNVKQQQWVHRARSWFCRFHRIIPELLLSLLNHVTPQDVTCKSDSKFYWSIKDKSHAKKINGNWVINVQFVVWLDSHQIRRCGKSATHAHSCEWVSELRQVLEAAGKTKRINSWKNLMSQRRLSELESEMGEGLVVARKLVNQRDKQL